GPGQTTRSGVVGTPLYMAPEVQRGAPASMASDVYGVGALLYELVAGRVPDTGDWEEAPQPALPVAQVVTDIHPDFAAVMDRCLRIDATERFPSAEELRLALEQLVARLCDEGEALTNPYRGLSAFEFEHAKLFFGRAAEAQAVLDRLRRSTLVV